MKSFYLITLVIFFVSCSGGDTGTSIRHTNPEKILLKRSHEFTNYSDSIFFVNIKDIEIIDQKYYFADKGQNKIYIFQKNWELATMFGSSGPGPSEFSGVSNIAYNHNLIGIADMESSSIKLFDKNHKFIKSVKRPYVVDSSMEFAMDSSDMLYQQSTRYELISKYDFASKILSSYGDFENDFSLKTKSRNNQQTNQWHVAISKNKLFIINQCEPLILSYDLSSKEKTGTYDLSKVESLQKRINFTDIEIQSDPYANVNYILFSDILVKGEHVYLLYTDHIEPNNKVISNEVLHLKLIDGNRFEEIEILQLNPYGWYETFIIDGNKLITFDSNASAIEEYVLK